MSREHKDLAAAVAEFFEASEGLYRATLKEVADGRLVDQSASRIAFSVVMESLKHRVACPDWAAQHALADWKRFEGFECASLGEAFGIPDHKFAEAERKKRLTAYVYGAVRKLQARHVPLKDNAKGKGALSIVGEQLHMSAKQVEKMVTDWRKNCRAAGMDPDEKPRYADATGVLSAASARGLKPDE
jgi:hypothetical protein